MQGYQHDPEDTEAETIVLQRVGERQGTAGDDGIPNERLRTLIVGRVVSTGDRFAGYEIIEIVPPDEPALVTEDTVLEMA
ncbi:MAG: hypothetical protein M3Q65_15020 [Chloroflexota bacterium]|nr:hypothetical protein [Chloroflexota bacterium]